MIEETQIKVKCDGCGRRKRFVLNGDPRTMPDHARAAEVLRQVDGWDLMGEHGERCAECKKKNEKN